MIVATAPRRATAHQPTTTRDRSGVDAAARRSAGHPTTASHHRGVRRAVGVRHPLERRRARRAGGRRIGAAVADVPDARHSAVLIVLSEGPLGAEVLLTRRSMQMRSHRGEISFPGGRCDPGETPVETALREAEEEVGLDMGRPTVVGELEHLSTIVSRSYIVPVVATLDERLELEPRHGGGRPRDVDTRRRADPSGHLPPRTLGHPSARSSAALLPSRRRDGVGRNSEDARRPADPAASAEFERHALHCLTDDTFAVRRPSRRRSRRTGRSGSGWCHRGVRRSRSPTRPSSRGAASGSALRSACAVRDRRRPTP